MKRHTNCVLILLCLLFGNERDVQAQQQNRNLTQLESYLNQHFNSGEKRTRFDQISSKQISSEDLLQYVDSTEQKIEIGANESCYQYLLSNSKKHHYQRSVRLFVVHDSLHQIKQVLLTNQEYLNIIAWYEFEDFLSKNELELDDLLDEIAQFFDWKELTFQAEKQNILIRDEKNIPDPYLEFSLSVEVTNVLYDRDFVLHPLDQISLKLKQHKCVFVLKSPDYNEEKLIKNKGNAEFSYFHLYKTREITYNIGFRTVESDLIKYHYTPVILDPTEH